MRETPPPIKASAEGSSLPRLFEEIPALAREVPWLPLVHGPTPVERCDAIAPWLGRDDVWMKRDDLASPLYGGNKVRRFEHLFADAQRRGAREIITVGGLASTQVTATLLFGRSLGFDVTAVLFGQPVTSFARRSLLLQASTGGRLIHGGGYVQTALRTALAVMRGGRRSYFVPPGASTPMANLGYVGAMLEIADQVERKALPRPDIIVLPSGSGGTAAALCVGIMMLGWSTTVVGVRITDRIACNRVTLRFLVEATARYLAKRGGRPLRRSLPDPRFIVDHRAAGAGYGHPTPEAIEAVPQVERLLGVPGEITYSGKALVGLRRIAAENPGKNILLWNTLSAVWPAPTVGPEALPPAFARYFRGDVPI
jgi:1-aminocyclopropane-1-carboxylate deaminase/D-cysteine desulfhydrase-like pyridoxal-dependent ACC family enzyme